MTNFTVLRDSIVDMDPPQPVLTRLRQLVRYYEALGYDEFDSFVSETTSDEGERVFESLWLFNREATMEGLINEGGGDQLDGARLDGRLQRWAVRSRNYNFREAEPNSRLSVQLWYSDDLWGELNASGSNCDRLLTILKKHVTPLTGATAPALETPDA